MDCWLRDEVREASAAQETERSGAAAVRWPQYIDMIGDLGLDPNAIWPYLL